MEVTMFFPLLLLLCSGSTAQPPPESDNEITPHGDNQARQPANVSLNKPTCPEDIHAVLREMSSLLAEQRVELRHLQRENEGQAAKLRELELQKNQLEKMNQHVKEQAEELRAIKAWTNETENQVEALRRETAVKRVAFSAALSSSDTTMGPFNTYTNLVFRHVIANIGNAYNPNTGFFIAPVKGAYHFELYISAHGHPSHPLAVTLMRNGHGVCAAFELQPSGYGTSANGVTLLLEAGDVLFLRMSPNSRIHDNEHHHSTFSGHLLFTV